MHRKKGLGIPLPAIVCFYFEFHPSLLYSAIANSRGPLEIAPPHRDVCPATFPGQVSA